MTFRDLAEFGDRNGLRATRWFARVLLVMFAICLAVATHWPNPRIAQIPGILWADKICHFVAYSILTALLLYSYRDSHHPLLLGLRRWRLRNISILALVLTVGMIDEITQPWFGRSFSYGDLAADGLGAALVLLVTRLAGYAPRLLRRLLPYERLELS